MEKEEIKIKIMEFLSKYGDYHPRITAAISRNLDVVVEKIHERLSNGINGASIEFGLTAPYRKDMIRAFNMRVKRIGKKGGIWNISINWKEYSHKGYICIVS